MLLPAGVAIVSAFVALWQLAGQGSFVPQACSNVEAYLAAEVVGQDLAIRQLTDAVCYHISREHKPAKPLIISVHGPPGVGKTLTHQLLARALYNRQPSDALECPGRHCYGYKILYGMDYLVTEKEQRLGRLRDELLLHLRQAPQSFIVIEEYDKLDCETRSMFRQLWQHPELANTSWSRSVIMMESNLGMSELQQMLSVTGGRSQVTPEVAEKQLRDLVFTRWHTSGCEGFEDTLKLTSLIDFYLPYFPLELSHVRELAARQLAHRGRELARHKRIRLAWRRDVPDFLASKVEFSGPYPMEGGKGVESAVTRYVARLLRKQQPAGHAKTGGSLVLSVAADGTQLEAAVVADAEGQSSLEGELPQQQAQ